MEEDKVEKPVYIKEGNRIVKCALCEKPILKGHRIFKKDSKTDKNVFYIYRPAQFQPVALQPRLNKRGEYITSYIHAECSHISFGEKRRALASGKSLEDLFGK